MTPDRCKWCGCFVAAGTEPTTREIRAYADQPWRTHTQLLCPGCAESWTTDQPWNRAPTTEAP